LTPANLRDSQILPLLLDPENEHDHEWEDSAYSGATFQDLLNLADFKSVIYEKCACNYPLSDAARDLNRINSAIRACVENVFGRMIISMSGKLIRTIGLERSEA